MTTLAQIEAMEKRKEKITQAIAAVKKDLRGETKKAENHVKLALGSAVISLIDTIPATVRHAILTGADQGIQKQGLGREKFEALKARFTKKIEEQK